MDASPVFIKQAELIPYKRRSALPSFNRTDTGIDCQFSVLVEWVLLQTTFSDVDTNHRLRLVLCHYKRNEPSL